MSGLIAERRYSPAALSRMSKKPCACGRLMPKVRRRCYICVNRRKQRDLIADYVNPFAVHDPLTDAERAWRVELYIAQVGPDQTGRIAYVAAGTKPDERSP